MHPIDFDPHISPGEVADYLASLPISTPIPPVNQCFN